MALINDEKGRNNLVKTKRGVKHKGIKFDFNKNIEYINDCDGVDDEDLEKDNDDDVEFKCDKVWWLIAVG